MTIDRARRAFLTAMLLGCLAGCGGGASARSPTDPSSTEDFRSEPEYEQGLSEVIQYATTEYAADVLTERYSFGYVTGRLEGNESRERENAEAKELGCMRIAPALLELTGEGFRGMDFCKSMQHRDLSQARFSGPRFAKGRLVVVRNAVKAGDQEITRMVLDAYQDGYARGFGRSSEQGERIKELRNAVTTGCGDHVESYPGNSRILERCFELGGEYVETYLASLRRVRAERTAR